MWIALEELQVPYDTRVGALANAWSSGRLVQACHNNSGLQLVDKANKTKEFAELYQSIVPDPEATSKVPIVVGVATARERPSSRLGSG